jgi:phosphomannomutase
MDDRPSVVDRTRPVYRCPGQSYSIDHAVHLGRLAAFYPECRHCVHRGDTALLAPLQIRQWAELDAHKRHGPRCTAEGLEGHSLNEISPSIVRHFAGALGLTLARRHGAAPSPPAVLVGSDGHWTSAELVAAACQALQWAGCRTLEIGAVTSASLAAATHRLQADAALLIGNATGQPHSIGLKLWGRGGRPWSSPGDLDTVLEFYQSKIDRPKRRGGGLERASAGEAYLAPLASLFHGLRPLRFVVDTTCEPLLHYLRQLNAQAACEILRPRQAVATLLTADVNQPFVARRLEHLAGQLLDAKAHWGLWIDGHGEACFLIDEQGKPVECENLYWTLANFILRAKPGATLVVERQASGQLEQALTRLGARVVRAEATRQALSQAMHAADAVFGGGASGRFWYAGEPAAPDALLTASLVLTVLSQSDRPLSEVVDAAAAAMYK